MRGNYRTGVIKWFSFGGSAPQNCFRNVTAKSCWCPLLNKEGGIQLAKIILTYGSRKYVK